MPAPLEDQLVRILGRASGIVMVAAAVALSLALATWSAGDPSLTFATDGRVHNMIGALGAIASDLLLQMLGFAAVPAMIAPLLWGIELTSQERIEGFRTKAALYPLSLIALAAGLSALPTPESWPLHHGLGGILGDVLFNFASSLVATINPERARLVAGLVLFGGGGSTLAGSVGLKAADLRCLLPQGLARKPSNNPGTWLRERWQARRDAAVEPQLGPIPPAPSQPPPQPMMQAQPPMHPMAMAASWPTTSFYAHHAAMPGPQPTHHAPQHLERQPMPAMQAPWAPAPSPVAAQAEAECDFAELGDNDPLPSFITGRQASRVARDEARRADAAADPAAAAQAPAQLPAAGTGMGGLLRGLGVRRGAPAGYRRPSLNLLKRPSAARPQPELAQTVLRGNARLLEDVLKDFGVKGEIRDVRPGPVVTLYELEPARGTKSARVIGLSDDIARSMSAASVRVAVVPGRNAIGIELPNVRRESVLLREILETDAYRASDAALPMALGKSIGGEPVVVDLARMPHLLVAGTTGSGKSVGINAFILSLLYRHAPEDCRLLMIDPKMLELSVYDGIPHLLTPVVTDPHKAVAALEWAVREMEERYKRMAKLSVRNIDVFNNRVRNARKRGEMLARTVQTGFDSRTGQAIFESQSMELEPMPYIVVVVDELADLMIVAGKEIEAAVQRLAQMARAAGIHLILATQRPSVDIITGVIKANFPCRLSYKVASKIDSRTILNEQGAEQLLGQGDMLYSSGSGQPVRVHGAFVADEEVQAIAQALREQGQPRYVDGITDGPPQKGTDGRADEERGEADIYDRAVAVVMRDQKASASYLQRRLGIGYNRAADLIERMEREGLVSPASAVGKRDILGMVAPAAE
jgi:S-DNA-T family DNA segregation ATPase FtsK/SpoIIIE